MKKFLAVLLTLIVTVALGFTIFYLVRDNEEIYLSTSTLYVSKGDNFDIDINFKNKKSYTTYEVIVDKSTVVRFNEEDKDFTAIGGGYTKVLYRTSNVNYRNLDCVVYVGDGLSKSTPFYISSAEELALIGKEDADGNVKYPLDAYYALRDNIDISYLTETNGFWAPIGYNAETGDVEEFTGHFDGRGYSIINMNLNKVAYNEQVDLAVANDPNLVMFKHNYTDAGLFAKLGENAEVKNVKFENASITGEYDTAGLVAGSSIGAKIERIEVKQANLDLEGTAVAGAIVGKMESKLVNKLYTTATIDRAGVNINLITSSQVFGGLVGENVGGYVVYSYVRGNAELFANNATTLFGGIVAKNIVAINSVDAVDIIMGAHVKDCYTSIELSYTVPTGGASAINSVTAGLIIGINKTDSSEKEIIVGNPEIVYTNKIVGNYYNNELNSVTVGADTTTYNGVAKMTNKADGTIDYVDTEYQVQGKTFEELTHTETYKSHIDSNDIVLWKFGTVWIETANALPVLDYSEQAVSADLYTMSDGAKVSTAEAFINKLQNYSQTEPIIIGADIDFADEGIWQMIGTKDNPFKGQIYADYKENAHGEKEYYRLKNITTANAYNNNKAEYAAMFGFIASEGGLHNIILEGAKFINGKYSAGLAIQNDGLIEDCAVVNSTIKGEIASAGIAIINNGTIKRTANKVSTNGNTISVIGTGVAVTDTVIETSIVESTSVLLSGNVSASGIVVTNNGNIDGVTVKGNAENYSIKVVSKGTSANAMLAGVACENFGSVKNANVSFVSASDGIKAEGTFTAVAGGISAVTIGSISNSFVSANITTSLDNDRCATAGVVVEILEAGYITQSGFYGNNKSIVGYTAGGVAKFMSQTALRKIGLGSAAALIGNVSLNTTKEDMGNGVTECFVAGNTVVKGHSVAGLVVDITNGALLDSYVGTGVVLTGVNSSSQVANIVLTSDCNAGQKTDGKFSTAIIAYCYSDAEFDNAGTSYAISSQNILETPVGQYEKKSCGFGAFIYVSSSKTGGAKFFDGAQIYNWFKDGQGNCKTSDDEMYSKASDNKFISNGFSTEIWSLDSTQLGGARGSKDSMALANAMIDTSLLLVD